MSQAMGAVPAPSQPLALFVSDVHLQERMPATTAAFLRFLTQHAPGTANLFVLGDLFEYWAGDDDLDTPLHRNVLDALRALSDAGTALHWVAGNRDFLVGQEFAHAAGMTRLPDGSVVRLGTQSIVLAHGDAQCTDDVAYMKFRHEVRSPEWQQTFLAMPLSQRKAIIDNLRLQSRDAQRGKSADIMDVNPAAIEALFEASGCALMVHGHTHRPATHVTRDRTGQLRTRYVLPDWDVDAAPQRGGWLTLCGDGRMHSYGIDGAPS
ncbi:MAG: UDP-2,3-diacylglucosamine diphosphatase [Pseudomonadota bacterium]|nr:UDP-2,3-diacylglucosamine diphosphatase [Pseudomonadota bacterium]